MNSRWCWGSSRQICGGVYVAHDGEVLAVLGARGVHVRAAHHVGHGAVGRRLREQHGLGRVEQLGRLAHELHAAQHDGMLGQVHGEAGEGKGVAHVVGHGLDLGRHVVVGKDHGVVLLLEAIELTPELAGDGALCRCGGGSLRHCHAGGVRPGDPCLGRCRAGGHVRIGNPCLGRCRAGGVRRGGNGRLRCGGDARPLCFSVSLWCLLLGGCCGHGASSDVSTHP